MSRIVTTFLFLIALNLVGFSQEMKNHEIDDVTIKHPAGWEVVDIEKKKKENPQNPMVQSVLFEISADKESDEAKSVQASKLDMTGKNATLDQIQQFFEKMYSNAQSDIQILKKGSGEVNGYEFRSMTVKAELESADVLSVQRVLLDGKYAYVVSVSSPLAEFANFKATGDKILDSFQVN